MNTIQKKCRFADIKLTGMEVARHYYHENDADETLHFCLVYQNHHEPGEYLVNIDHCGKYGHAHTVLRMRLYQTKPMNVLVLGYSVLSYELLQGICLSLGEVINNI